MRPRRSRAGTTERAQLQGDLLEQAAYWHARLSEPSVSDSLRTEFEFWRRANPANSAAYERIRTAGAAMREMAGSSAMLALRHETLTRIVIARRREPTRRAIAAGLAVVLGATGALLFDNLSSTREHSPTLAAAAPTTRTYQTAVGERLTITLADGSVAALNTSTRLRVVYSASERRLVLDRGQALFEVARNSARPFTVVAGDRIVTAHGTAFEVRVDQARIAVALIEGQVTVGRNGASAAAPVTRMQPNDILVATGGTTRVTKSEDAKRLVSWRDGLVVFDNERLADAVHEVNRYVTTPILLGDERLAELRISGVFRTGETSAFVEALELGFSIRVVHDNQGRTTLTSRS